VSPIIESGFSLLTFDFSGSGISDGEYVSLGWYESMDVQSVVESVRTRSEVGNIYLWGRSMGGATSIIYAS